MILKRLYDSNCFDYKKFILDNLKPLSLDITEAVILIKIIDYYKESDAFNIEKIKESIAISKKQFDTIMASLLEKNYYNIYLKDNGNISEEAISIEGFFERCEVILSSTLVKDSGEFQEILRLVSINLNKILTGTEIEIITSLVNDDMYTKKEFEDAFLVLKDRKISNIKALSLELEKGRKNKTPKLKEKNAAFMEFYNKIK